MQSYAIRNVKSENVFGPEPVEMSDHAFDFLTAGARRDEQRVGRIHHHHVIDTEQGDGTPAFRHDHIARGIQIRHGFRIPQDFGPTVNSTNPL